MTQELRPWVVFLRPLFRRLKVPKERGQKEFVHFIEIADRSNMCPATLVHRYGVDGRPRPSFGRHINVSRLHGGHHVDDIARRHLRRLAVDTAACRPCRRWLHWQLLVTT